MYHINTIGTIVNETNTFSLSNWDTGSGGSWESWYVDNGTLIESIGSQIDCSVLSTNDNDYVAPKVCPNPFRDVFFIESEEEIIDFSIIDVNGRLLLLNNEIGRNTVTIDKTALPKGVFLLKLQTNRGISHYKLLKK